MAKNLFNVDDLLEAALGKESLKQMFQKKIKELRLTQTAALEILEMESRTLKGILEGGQKTVDVTNLIKLADFLLVPKEVVFKLYLDLVQQKHPSSTYSSKKIAFIKENFDLAVLKKAGLINSMIDFVHIEQRILRRLGLRSIYEYKKPEIDVAFSSGLFKPKNQLTRSFWIRSAIAALEEIDNPNPYDRTALIKFFPHISWYTLNEERGLTEVIRSLFKLGITVIFQPNLQGLQVKGATFGLNGNPCVVLTNYQGFYSTLWFSLIHELYHVLFDWEEIRVSQYHLSDDDVEELTVIERETLADKFAQDYLFDAEKMSVVKPRLSNISFVKAMATEHHVHHSIVYSLAAHANKNNRSLWALLRTVSPNMEKVISNVDYPWADDKRVEDFVSEKKQSIYI